MPASFRCLSDDLIRLVAYAFRSGSFKAVQETLKFINADFPTVGPIRFPASLEWLNHCDEDDSLALLNFALEKQMPLDPFLVRDALGSKQPRVLDLLLRNSAPLPPKTQIFIHFGSPSHAEIYERYFAHPRVVAQGPMTLSEKYRVASLAGAEFVSRHGGCPTVFEDYAVALRPDLLHHFLNKGETLSWKFLLYYACEHEDFGLFERAMSVRGHSDRLEVLELLAHGSYKLLNRFFPNLHIPPHELDALLWKDQEENDYNKPRLTMQLKYLQAHGCLPSSQAVIGELFRRGCESYEEDEGEEDWEDEDEDDFEA